MVNFFSEKDIKDLNLTLEEVFKNIEECYIEDYKGNVEVPNKIGIHPEYKNSFMHAMPASITGENRAAGLKWVSYYPNNYSRGLEDSSGLIILNDPLTGEFLCVMEGMYITFLRTTACAAVAAKRAVKTPPKTLSLVGCGGLGTWSARFFTYAFPSITKVYVSSRRPESRASFIDKISKEIKNVEFIDASDLESSLAVSDIVVSSVPPTDNPPIKKGMFKENSIFIPLDLTNSWESELYEDFDTVYLDNLEGFNIKIKSKVGSEINNKKIVEIKEAIANNESGDDGLSFVAICGIASIDIFLSDYIYKKLMKKGSGFKFDFKNNI